MSLGSRYILRAFPRPIRLAPFTSAPTFSSSQPNAPLDLDPGFRALLKDVDISITNHKAQQHCHTELQELSAQNTSPDLAIVYEGDDRYKERKSPAALFGSQSIGAVVIPSELEKSITLLISDSNKRQLHSDAKRLFHEAEVTDANHAESQWETRFDVKYRSRQQALRHSERDGTAFASIALPAHYSAICAVLEHVKKRLGSKWKVNNVVDWGVGAGSGLWACLHSFQLDPQQQSENTLEGSQISQSSVSTYLGIDKRDGLVATGKRLLRDVNLGQLNLTWRKSLQGVDKPNQSDGKNMLALSAFRLSSLPSPSARKTLVREMWESGAHVMVLIDHSDSEGFKAILNARNYLLKAGVTEVENSAPEDAGTLGSHVVAPCPHDKACPLEQQGSSQFVCGFSQRLQRPSFMRLTKHSGVGHEDIEYSYVVVRRGPRPIPGPIMMGRIGEVGRRSIAQEASRKPLRELTIHDETTIEEFPPTTPPPATTEVGSSVELASPEKIEEALRLESFSWPRLVFPPLKRSGHIILDSCTAEGKIMRLTIPKSQGKQEFYDARKSSWGDIFPHEPKNPPHERFRSKTESIAASTKKGGKGSKSFGPEERAKHKKELKKERRSDRVRVGERLDYDGAVEQIT